MFEELLNNQDTWLNGKGPHSDIVFSSRIRLARNFSDYPFPSKANSSHKEFVLKRTRQAISKLKIIKNSIFVDMEEVSSLDRQFLLERHLISQEHLSHPKGKGLIVSSDERISLMINEEDHLRMQVITSGFNLDGCWKILNQIDNELNKVISFAFLPEIGYLTACPTNVGTGLRASCMLHLPALVLTKRINRILELLAKISFTTRGLFGEGTQALGDFFQISNQVSLGLSEEELIENLKGVVKQVKEQEMEARNILLNKHRLTLEDRIWRSFGILKNSRLISSKEAFQHLSMLSLGLDLGIIKEEEFCKRNKGKELINNLFIIIQPAHLQKIEGRLLREKERDSIRATILRRKLGGNNV
jgi:protein arginine kinase